MPVIYKSKFDTSLALIGIGIIVGTLIFMVIARSWLGIVIDVFALAFVIHMFATTNYTINGTTLLIKCGFLYNQQLDISTIKKISESNNPISSPATSIDRLEIVYNKRDTVLISPKNKQGFLNHLKEINPDIQVKLKTNTKKNKN